MANVNQLKNTKMACAPRNESVHCPLQTSFVMPVCGSFLDVSRLKMLRRNDGEE